MRENNYSKESIICIITCLAGLAAFLAAIYFSSILMGESLDSIFPDIPASQLMNWDKIAKIFGL
ncbi:hypothetical protein AS034_14365 [[Bacillus] enclensis]|uniref:Uncharacterized protein n=2 Tax=Rossellomorea TaxID=2837508 RepID=A0A0V8HFX1_9BACI|nr:hypothetical protein [[Bacillus] enclensis]OAT85084.1 hypothetical protein A6P54_19790 [Bacillus sp. MKU004]QTC41179.1 hypothetical protein I7V34_19225 [Bacillus sp. V3]QWC23270.1 hypothetical protein KJK41_02520 [Bacillus haikouensis]KSU61523.1 hypothetical protein AS034_14365 [[Bacillus] enclensis]MBH9967650.1 hypothetical protein [[Bacillus] enclensis]